MPREMTLQEEHYFMHVLSKDPMFKDFINQQAAFQNPMKRLMNMPVCPKCERGAFHHQKGVKCPSCGYEGPAAHMIKTHFKEGWYK